MNLATIKAELRVKYPDPLTPENKLLYYMECAERYGQELAELEHEATACKSLLAEAGRLLLIGQFLKAQAMQRVHLCKRIDELTK